MQTGVSACTAPSCNICTTPYLTSDFCSYVTKPGLSQPTSEKQKFPLYLSRFFFNLVEYSIWTHWRHTTWWMNKIQSSGRLASCALTPNLHIPIFPKLKPPSVCASPKLQLTPNHHDLCMLKLLPFHYVYYTMKSFLLF